jgi:phage portal protein BeeE
MSPVKKPKDTQEAEEILQEKPLVVLFYMEGCPHCAANKPAWDKFKKSCKLPMAEIEANETPSSSGVNGFPTMMYIKEGGERTVISGKRESAKDIAKELGVPTSGGRRATRRRSHARRRQLRHRTSRNYVPLVKLLTRRRIAA